MTRACTAVGVRALLLGGVTFCAVALPSCLAAQSTGATRAVTARLDTARSVRAVAQSRAAAGDHRAAISGFGRVIATMNTVPAAYQETAVLADAHFGRASSLLQLSRSGDIESSSTTVTGDVATAIKDYDDAIALDSARFFGAASNNAGLLLRDAGAHRDAVRRFLAAGSTTHPGRGAFLMHAGDEYAALALPDSAAATYRAALKADSTLAGAREGLLRAFAARPAADSLLRVATRWSSDPRHSPQVTDVMYSALSSARWQRGGNVSGAIADSCLMLLAVNFSTMGLGPPDISRNHLSRLQGIAVAEPTTKGGVDAMLAAYAAKPDVSKRLPSGDLPGAQWWGRSETRRTTWSTLLGSIGRWYDTRDDDTTAVAYYEAALGIPWRYNEPPMWMDIDLIFPLAMRYSQPSMMSADPKRLNRFLDSVFGGKMVAYQRQDDQQIRRFHTALGAFFASRKEWGNGPRGAVFQLESMHTTTRRINRANPNAEPLRDSPELLLQHFQGYCATGATARAAALSDEIAAEYRRLVRPQSVAATCPRTPSR